ncbi:MAG: HEAT repeat domain-containing protein [Gemmataceae bacterium]
MSLIALEVGTNVGRRLGSPLVGPLLELLRKEPSNAALRYYALPLLGELGPDPRSFNYLGEVLAAGNHDDCYHAIRALGRMGKDAEPILLRVADDPGRKSSEGFLQRTMAIEALGRVSDASTLTPRLKKWLVVDNSNLVREAVLTADQTRASGVLPELTALARRPDDSRQHIWQNVHTAALTAVAHLADRDTAIKLLTEMLDAPDGSRRGMAALLLGSLDGLTAVPRLLDLLADRDWYVRAQSDRALQALARYPEGVRYDANKPNPEVWRKYWNDRN